MRHILFAAVVLFAATSASTQIAPQPPRALLVKGRIVNLKVPLSVLAEEGRSGWDNTPIYAAHIVISDGRFTVQGVEDWQSKGFPSLIDFKIEKIGKKNGANEVELRSTTLWVKLRFRQEQDLAAAFGAVAVNGPFDSPEAREYREQAYARLAKFFFTGPLAEIPSEKQQLLVRFAHVTASGTTIRSQSYKGNLYLVVDLGRDTTVYNDLKFNQSTLIAHVLNEGLLTVLKDFADPVQDVAVVKGLKIEAEIPHVDFVSGQTAKTYKLELYAPVDQIKRFSQADITNQQFIDDCIVIVDGNRIQVSLSAPVGT